MNLKRPGLWAAGVLLVLALGCKKDADNTTPTPTETACQIKKVSFGTLGEYELYESDANGRTTKFWMYYADANGKIPASVNPSTIIYNAQSLAERFNWSDGSGYDLLSYTNGALSKIEVYVQNKKVYQFDVTTNASKQITAMKGTSFDKTFGNDYTTTFTLDAQGRYTSLTNKNGDGDFYREVRTGFEPNAKSYYDNWAANGVPIDPAIESALYGQYMPTAPGATLKNEYYWGYDANDKYVGLKKDGEYTFSRKLNSRSYVTERTNTDVLAKTTSKNTYEYSNCN